MAEREVERRLAAIMSVDLVGYSRLMNADEEGTLARLKAVRGDTLDPTIEGHRGRVVKGTGDGVLAEFASVVDAVRCGLEIQRQMRERNEAAGDGPRLDFRIGINTDDIIFDAGDIFGHGVNLAARIESVAQPGDVVVGRTVRDQVRDKLPYEFEDLGERQLKNIAHPVQVFRVMTKAEAKGKGKAAPVPAAGQAPAAPFAPPLSILVLPFANLSGDPEQEYFADGVTEDLTSDLTRIPGSFVIARNTAFTYKGKSVDVSEVGRELGVRYVLEGSVRRVGDRVRINAQLIEAATNAHLWAHRFDAATADLLELQDDVTGLIARALNVELVHAESRRGQSERPDNPDALDLAMRGWSIMYLPLTKDGLARASDCFERALKLDERLGQALVGLAEARAFEVGLKFTSDAPGHLRVAGEAVAKALAIEPTYARAHYVQALLYRMMGKFDLCLAALDRAIALDRNLAAAHAQRAFVLIYLDRGDEAKASIEDAIRRSPRDFNLSNWLYILAAVHWLRGEYREQIEASHRAIAANRDLPQNHLMLALAHAHLGRREEGLAALAEFLRLRPGATLGSLRKEYWSSGSPTFLDKVARGEALFRELGMPD